MLPMTTPYTTPVPVDGAGQRAGRVVRGFARQYRSYALTNGLSETRPSGPLQDKAQLSPAARPACRPRTAKTDADKGTRRNFDVLSSGPDPAQSRTGSEKGGWGGADPGSDYWTHLTIGRVRAVLWGRVWGGGVGCVNVSKSPSLTHCHVTPTWGCCLLIADWWPPFGLLVNAAHYTLNVY